MANGPLTRRVAQARSQPGQLAAAVPAQEQQRNLAGFAEQISGLQQQVEGGLEQVGQRVERGAEALQQRVEGASLDDIANQIIGLEEQALEQQVPIATEEEIESGAVPRELGFLQELKARALSNLDEKPAFKKKIAQASLGKEFDVIEKDGEIFFKKKGSKKFQPIDRSSTFSSVREFLGDITADIAGDLIETGAALGVEAGGAVVAGPAGVLAAAPLAGATGVAARKTAAQAAASALGVEENVFEDFGRAATNAAVLNTAFLGAGVVGRKVIQSGAKFFRQLNQQSFTTSIKRSAEAKTAVREVRDALDPFPGTRRETGQKITSILEGEEKALGKSVGSIRGKILRISASKGEPKFTPKNLLEGTEDRTGLREVLDDFDEIAFDTAGKASFEAPVGAIRGFATTASGRKLLKELVRINNKVVDSGGLSFKQIDQELDALEGLAGFARAGGDRTTKGIAKNLRTLLNTDRFDTVLQLSPDDSAARTFANSFKNYTNKIDEIRDFTKALKSKSPENTVATLFKPKNSQNVVNLKKILGAESKTFMRLKSEWVTQLFERAIDPKTGAINADKFRSFLKLDPKSESSFFGKDMIAELLTEGEQRKLLRATKLAEEASIIGLEKPAAFAKLRAAFVLTIGTALFPQQKIRQATILLSSKPELIERVLNEGVDQVAKTLPTRSALGNLEKITQGLQSLSQFTRLKTKRIGGKEVERLVPVPEAFASALSDEGVKTGVDAGLGLFGEEEINREDRE